MADFSDFATAAQAVANPATSALDLAHIVQAQPSLWPQVAAHPNIYPALSAWLETNGDPATKQVVASRRGTPAPAPALPAPMPAPAPAAPVPPMGRMGRLRMFLRVRRKLVSIIAAIVVVALVAGIVAWQVFGRRGASSPQAAVSGLMTSLANGKLSVSGVEAAFSRYVSPSELDLMYSSDFNDVFTKSGTTQARLVKDLDAVLGDITVKVSNVTTSVEMIDTGLARVTVTNFTLDESVDVTGMQRDMLPLINDVLSVSNDLSNNISDDYGDSGNWLGQALMNPYEYQLTQWFSDGTCQAPKSWPGDYVDPSDLTSSEAVTCLADQAPVELVKSISQALSNRGLTMPVTMNQMWDRSDWQSMPAGGPFVMAVKEGGSWFVSPMMTLGEYETCSMSYQYSDHSGQSGCLPATSQLAGWASTHADSSDDTAWLQGLRQPMPTGNGVTSATPDQAVQTTLSAAAPLLNLMNSNSQPSASSTYSTIRAFADTLPPAERRLIGTYPFMAARYYPALGGLSGSFSTKSTSGSKAIVNIDSLTPNQQSGAAGEWTINQGDCLAVNGDSYCLSDFFDINTFNQDMSSWGGNVSVASGAFNQASQAFQATSPVSQIGLIAVKNGGGWQFSPMGSLSYNSVWAMRGVFAAITAVTSTK